MRCHLLSILLLLAALLCSASSLGASLPSVRPSMTRDGVDYVNMRDVCRRYGYVPQKNSPGGTLIYGQGSNPSLKKNYLMTLRPGKQDFYVGNYRFVLTHRVLESGGNIYISSVDFQKLVDPVLNPDLSKGRVFNTVVLDPGHGGHDAGATSYHVQEKACNLSLAKKVGSRLRKLGFHVVMTRDSDYFLTLGERVAIANRTRNAIFISIHHNSSNNSAANGIETFTLAPHGTTSPFARTRRTETLSGNDQDSENIALAAAVHSHVLFGLREAKTPTPDRGIQRARFSVLCTIRCPAILFEAGFVSNSKERELISKSSYQDKLADFIVKGIMAYRSTISNKAGSPSSTGASIRPGQNSTPTSSRTGRP